MADSLPWWAHLILGWRAHGRTVMAFAFPIIVVSAIVATAWRFSRDLDALGAGIFLGMAVVWSLQGLRSWHNTRALEKMFSGEGRRSVGRPEDRAERAARQRADCERGVHWHSRETDECCPCFACCDVEGISDTTTQRP